LYYCVAATIMVISLETDAAQEQIADAEIITMVGADAETITMILDADATDRNRTADVTEM